MNLKHTPGPWFTSKSVHPGGLLIKPIPGQVVAQCDELPEMEGNACLIAAAPELLDNLEALTMACLLIETGEKINISELLKQSRDAIKKAKGED